MNWILLASGSAFFAGITAVLAKIGIRNVNSNLATAIRTIVVLVFSWLMVFIKGSQTGLADIDARSLVFLVLSGLATGASWLCQDEGRRTRLAVLVQAALHSLRRGERNACR